MNRMSLEEYKENNHFMTYNSIEPVYAGKDNSEVRAELKEEGTNLNGYAHGGLLATMADCVAGMAARGDGRRYVTQNMNINFISNIKTGQLCAKGEVVHRGKTVSLVRIRIMDDTGKLLVEAFANMFCIDK